MFKDIESQVLELMLKVRIVRSSVLYAVSIKCMVSDTRAMQAFVSSGPADTSVNKPELIS